MSGRDIEALVTYIAARQQDRFGWAGQRDCGSFALNGVAAQTGVDILAAIPRWRTRTQALAIVKRVGGFITALDARMDRVPPALAKRGDVMGVPDDLFGVQLMLVEGVQLVGPGEAGLVRLPRKAGMMAWNAESARALPYPGADAGGAA